MIRHISAKPLRRRGLLLLFSIKDPTLQPTIWHLHCLFSVFNLPRQNPSSNPEVCSIMESITAQVRNLASRANDAARKKLIAGLQELAIKLETSSDTMDRITLLHLRIAAVRTAIDFKLFDVLAASKEPMTLNHLAEKTNVDPIFLGRLLRYLSSTSMMKETGKNAFTATNVTKTLADPGNQGGLRHYFDTCGPMFQAMPKYLAKIRYQNITKANETVFQEAFKTHKGPFAWYVEDDPETFAFFGEYMAARRKGMTGWLDVYPVEEETKNWDPSAPVFVDIGGGIGHQCVDLKTKHPDLPGKIVLQEYKDNVEHAQLPPGIEKMEHDMFTPQPVNGTLSFPHSPSTPFELVPQRETLNPP